MDVVVPGGGFGAARAVLAPVAAALCLTLWVLPPGHAKSEGPVRDKHGNWETRCETPAGAASEQCAIVQHVEAEKRENIDLVVIALKTADRKARLLRVIAPLKVLLPTEMGLRIDKDDMGRMNFVRCLPNGCVAEVIIDDKLLAKMESGQTITFVIFATPEEGIGVPAPLAGFKESFEALP
jgi:invasion protein IalB